MQQWIMRRWAGMLTQFQAQEATSSGVSRSLSSGTSVVKQWSTTFMSRYFLYQWSAWGSFITMKVYLWWRSARWRAAQSLDERAGGSTADRRTLQSWYRSCKVESQERVLGDWSSWCGETLDGHRSSRCCPWPWCLELASPLSLPGRLRYDRNDN